MSQRCDEYAPEIAREQFRKTLRSLLGALREFSSIPSFNRLMLHATGNVDFGCATEGLEGPETLEERDFAGAVEMVVQLDTNKIIEPTNASAAEFLFARLHGIARRKMSERSAK